MVGLYSFVLARKAGEEGTRPAQRSEDGWGGEGNEVEVPSSIPCHFVPWAPFFSRFAGEDVHSNPTMESRDNNHS